MELIGGLRNRAKIRQLAKLQIVSQFKMGQVLLEGCESNCQGKSSQQRSKQRSHIYLSNLAAHLPVYFQQSDLTNSVATRNKNGHFLQQIKHVPTDYIEFMNHLFVNKIKFEDAVFPADSQALLKGDADSEWARLGDMDQGVAAIFKQFGGGSRSKVLHLLQTLQQFSGFDACKPIYIDKVGMAVCILRINGQREDVVVDDLIPTSHLKYYTPKTSWFFLIEKALAKILGNYSFLDQFSIPELFQQITGLPYELQNRADWNNRDSFLRASNFAEKPQFQDAIHGDDPCYLPSEREGEVCYVRFLKGFAVKSLPINTTSQMASLLKVRVDRGGKVSLRLSFLNCKFVCTKTKDLGEWNLKLYRQEGEEYSQAENKALIVENNIYLGSTFMHLKAGRYILYIAAPTNNQRCNLVCYASEGTVTINELQPGQSSRDILQKIDPKSR